MNVRQLFLDRRLEPVFRGDGITMYYIAPKYDLHINDLVSLSYSLQMLVGKMLMNSSDFAYFE